jgi:PIN domain nuclease of toxin-antitoxin system
MALEEEKEKWDLEHKRYVYCKQLVQHQEMEIQKLNIKHEIDLTELRTNHKIEVEK